MNDVEENIENAVVDDTVQDREQAKKAAAFAYWQRMCFAGMATLTSSCIAWLQLADAAMVLNCMDLRMSPTEKKLLRHITLEHLFQTDSSCHDLLRMSPDIFQLLCKKLQTTRLFSNYKNTSIEEQVATFLIIIGQKFTNRAISFFMCRFGETISRYFHNVLRALISLEEDLVKQPTSDYHSEFIYQNSRFFPYFKDCIGALDGTHVRVKVPRLDAARYRGRKDFPTQNVLACCTFDLRFMYVLAGWEGSASDSRVLKSALTRLDPLRIPDGKYYLGDAGFGLTSKILVPYGKTRYHLKEYAVQGPQNPQELFNLRHSSLRNTIERCFGILKKRFPIISTCTECQYSCETMTRIIFACCILHNFLLETEADLVLDELEIVHTGQADALDEAVNEFVTKEESSLDYERGKDLSDHISLQMWEQYQFERNVMQSSTLV